MKQQLSPAEKKRVQIAFAVICVVISLDRLNKEIGISGENPAIQQISLLLDELFDKPENIKKAMIDAHNHKRVAFSKKVKTVNVASALIGSIDCLTDGTITPQPGTRLAFIIDTFAKNRKMIADSIPSDSIDASDVKRYKKRFKQVLFR